MIAEIQTLPTPPPAVISPAPRIAAPEAAPQFLADLLAWAFSLGATDIHLHPAEEGLCWLRIDGALREVTRYNQAIHARLIARLKVLGRCTAYDGELVQEGRFTLAGSGGGAACDSDGEIRLSIIPTRCGEKAVLRLTGGRAPLRDLNALGYRPELLQHLRAALDRPQGMLLVVGPSGSGKTTTLYALLHDLLQRAGGLLSVVTVEDPVEQPLAQAAQIEVDAARGLTFPAALRALLRQDPEVIMIGEIRDVETAATALQAALTGHRLLSSMHTLDAAEALIRLRLMGLPPYVIASGLSGILTTRLARLLCPDCARTRPANSAELAELFPAGPPPTRVQLAEPHGCEACFNSGWSGRRALGEWRVAAPGLAAALAGNLPAGDLSPHLPALAAAAPQALQLLRVGLIPLAEWRRLALVAKDVTP